ncbi:hypothetical protein M426DRAFT_130398 [Hypoxylon sp. CI-4A]|nr:hypothetical protein M426DRAFT_130398 [Hypoxylon sp. CI-4A]
MASQSASCRLYELPVEIFDQVISYVEDPADYLHLAASSRRLWQTLDAEHRCIILDARAFDRRREMPSADSDAWWARLVTSPPLGRRASHGYNSMLHWMVRAHRPVAEFQQALAVYGEEAPGIMNFLCKRTYAGPLDMYAIQQGNLDCFLVLQDTGLAPSVETHLIWGSIYLECAFEEGANSDIARWLVVDQSLPIYEHDIRLLFARPGHLNDFDGWFDLIWHAYVLGD